MGTSIDIVKAAKQDELVRIIVDKSSQREMRVGSLYIDSRGRYYCIDSMTPKKRVDWDASKEKQVKAEGKPEYSYSFSLKKKYEVKVDDVEVKYSTSDEYHEEFHYCGTKFLNYNAREFEDWVLVDDRSKYEQLAQDIIDGKADIPTVESELGGEETGRLTSLIHTSSAEHLSIIQQAAQERAQHFKVIQSHVTRVLEQKQRHLRNIRSQLGEVVDAFKKKVAKIERIIYVIELYLGINEEILQFQEGEKASVDEPICFRQRVMYMDEEVGDPRLDKYGNNEGLDFRNISAFDNWLCANENYKKVIPEPKCVCVFKVRREKKKGHASVDNPFIQFEMEEADRKTYILIRNGDNLYRIWVDLEVAERLFPHKDEMMQLQEEVLKHEGRGGWDEEKSKEKLETDHERYQRQFIMLQGLIDRTEILHPIKEQIKLTTLDLETTKLVRLIYDDGPSLVHAGYTPFLEWMKSINAMIDEGSRIVITSSAERESERFDDRFASHRDSNFNLPKAPRSGLYTVFKKTDERGFRNPKGWGERVKEVLFIRYNPGGEVRNWWDRWDEGHERKNKLPYYITKEDEFIMNFDAVTYQDIDNYLDSRIDRRHYVTMMPLLWEVRKQKKREDDDEKDFLSMVIAPYALKYREDVLLKTAKEEMTWWKTKNKWKRGLTKDDAKAFRMISNRLKKKFK